MLKHSRITKYKCPVKGRIIIKVFKGYVFFAVSSIMAQTHYFMCCLCTDGDDNDGTCIEHISFLSENNGFHNFSSLHSNKFFHPFFFAFIALFVGCAFNLVYMFFFFPINYLAILTQFSTLHLAQPILAIQSEQTIVQQQLHKCILHEK